MKLTVFVLTLAAATTLSLAAADKAVSACGMAPTYRGAVNEALISALEQETGVVISSQQRVTLVANQESRAVDGVGGNKSEIDDKILTEMRKVSEGRISGFQVTGQDYDAAAGQYRVEVTAFFQGPYDPPGHKPENRRRMAVVPFRPSTGDSISWFGQAESSAAWAALLADKLNERLNQTRKFTMVDRKFDAEIDAELARLAAPNAARADAVRLNQKLGTDYLVVGDVRFFPVVAPGVNPLTGQVMPMASQKFAEVSYRVLIAPTGQLKWSDTVVLDALEFPVSDIGSFMSATADGAASAIATAMLSNILPFEIVGVSASGSIIIGEGGKSLAEGERLTVFALGEMMRDSRTGEALDRIEEPVGTVEVYQVSPKMSYARVVEGDAKLMVPGCRLRRPKVVAPSAQVQGVPTPTTVGGNGTGGVVTPF